MLQSYNPLSPLYSPDLSPPEYFLFTKLKMKLKGLHFADVVEIQETATDKLKRVQKRNFWQIFIKYTTAQKLVYMCMVLNLNKKVTYLRFLKKLVLKIWTPLFIKMHVKIVRQAKDKRSFFQHSNGTLRYHTTWRKSCSRHVNLRYCRGVANLHLRSRPPVRQIRYKGTFLAYNTGSIRK